MSSKKYEPLWIFQLRQSKKSLLVFLGFLTIFFGCDYIENDALTLSDTPILSYSAGAGEVPFAVSFAEQFVAEPVLREGYTLDSFEVEYTVVSRPADEVESIYAPASINRSSIEPSIDSDTGAITFPAGFRVGYEIEVTVKAKVKSVPIPDFIISSRSPGDEVTFTFTYQVVDNGVDTDGDGVSDGLDLDIDGDTIPNVADPAVFEKATIDDAPVFSYTSNTYIAPFGEDFLAQPTVRPDYTLDSFTLEYTVMSRPADGVESIYASANINRFSIEPSIDSDTGVITFLAGFRVGYEIEVTVKAKVKSVPVPGLIISSLSPGDEVIQTLTYQVVDNGVDTDGDGVNDGLDLDIDGDGILNLADPAVFLKTTIDDAPVFSYSTNAYTVPFGHDYVSSNPVIRPGYTLDSFALEYTVVSQPTDGVDSIYAPANIKQPSIDSGTGAITFPAGFRVGYGLELTVKAKVKSVPVPGRTISSRSPGDEVTLTFIYQVVDNGVDTDGDGVNDGYDLDIDGDTIPNVADPAVFKKAITDNAPIFSYSTNANAVSFGHHYYLYSLVRRPGYTLGDFALEYRVVGRPTDGVDSIYASANIKQPSIDSGTGLITFPAGFRVGYKIEVTVKAKVKSVPVPGFIISSRSPGDEVTFTFTYQVVDNGLDTDGDGVNDGLDLDIDGDGILNVDDPSVFGRAAIDDAPVFSYISNTYAVPFGHDYVSSNPVIRHGYALDSFTLEYTVTGRPADGVESIYASTNVNRLDPSIDSGTGLITFPAGFRVGYKIEVTVKAKVKSVPVPGFIISSRSPGDEVTFTFIYQVVDNGVDTDGDGVNDGLDLDIDGDTILNVADPAVFEKATIDDAPIFSYSTNAVLFGHDYVSSPVIRDNYTLDSFTLEYRVAARPADGVESIYASTNVNRLDPSIDSGTGAITFPAGFRVGYGLELTVKAKVKSVPVPGLTISSRSPGDEVSHIFTYRVVDNGEDNDGDGVNDGLDLDIDGDGILNVADPTVYGGSKIDVAFLVDVSSSTSGANLTFIKSAIKELMTGLHGLTAPGSPADRLYSPRYNITRYFHRGRVVSINGKIVVVDDFNYESSFNFSEGETLSEYLAGADAFSHLNSPDSFTATATSALINTIFLNNSIYERGTIGTRPKLDSDPYTGSRAGAIKFIINLTDGHVSSGDHPNLTKSYELAKENDITIISVAVGDSIDLNSLKTLSRERADGIPLIFEEKKYASVKALSEAMISSIVAIEKAE